MKRVADLTMHIYEGMAIGRVFPQEQEFIIEDVFTTSGAHRFRPRAREK